MQSQGYATMIHQVAVCFLDTIYKNLHDLTQERMTCFYRRSQKKMSPYTSTQQVSSVRIT